MSNLQLTKAQIKPLVHGYGICIASNMITVDGYPVLFMYREEPQNEIDSGWCFLSGFESDQYMNNKNNHAVHEVNTIANYDPSIIPFLDAPVGSAFEKNPMNEKFERVKDWE